MKILAAADIHGKHPYFRSLLDAVMPTAAEAIVLAGDLLGYPPGFDSVEDAQRADAESIGIILKASTVPVFFIMGNDDFVDLGPGTAMVRSIHGQRVDLGEYNFVGYRYSLPFMGGINEKTEDAIAKDLEDMAPLADARTIFVTHSPAKGHLDRTMLDTHAGSASILDFIRRTGVRAHIHGHLHSGFGRDGRHFNVAALPGGRAMWIDLASMSHRILELARE